MHLRSRALLFAVGALLVGAAWLLQGSHDSGSETPLAEPADGITTGQIAASDILRTEVPEATVGPLRMVDKLSEKELDLGATILQGEAEPLEVSSGDPVDLSDFDADARIRLDERGNADPVVADLSEASDWTGSEWRSVLPYNSGLTVRLVGAPQSAAPPHSEFHLLPHPSTLSLDGGEASDSGPFRMSTDGMTFEGQVKWLFRKGALRSVARHAADASHAAEIYQPLEGSFVVLWMDGDGNQAIGEVTLTRGERSEVTLTYRPRPTLSGTLRDWNGDPVPHAHVKLIVNLNLADYDFLPMDRHAFGAVRSDDFGWLHTVEQQYRTDEDGRFSCSVPRGKEYAVQSYALDSYAFWSTLDSAAAPSDAMSAELTLLEPNERNRVRIHLLDSEGAPLAGAKVLPCIVSDFPFLRQWPLLVSDATGTLDFVGLEPGMHVGFFIQHGSLANGACSERVVIPGDRNLTIRAPKKLE